MQALSEQILVHGRAAEGTPVAGQKLLTRQSRRVIGLVRFC